MNILEPHWFRLQLIESMEESRELPRTLASKVAARISRPQWMAPSCFVTLPASSCPVLAVFVCLLIIFQLVLNVDKMQEENKREEVL